MHIKNVLCYIIKTESDNEWKELDIKNCTSFYFDDIIQVEDFNFENIYKNQCENILKIYRIPYKNIMDERPLPAYLVR